MKKGYGHIPRKVDPGTDIVYALPRVTEVFEPYYNLCDQVPACKDQRLTNSCVWHGIQALIWSGLVREGLVPFDISRLFGYWNTRNDEKSASKDEGCEIEDAIRVCNRYGIVPENLWDFDDTRVLDKPPDYVYQRGQQNKLHFYANVILTDLNHIRKALSHRLPVTFGFPVPQNFEDVEIESDGVLKMPESETDIVGYHDVDVFGMDDAIQMAICRNSWGTEWGIQPKKAISRGWFLMPYKYFTSGLCTDGYVIRMK